MTNHEKIKEDIQRMDAKELAEKMAEYSDCSRCPAGIFCGEREAFPSCEETFEAWLKEEATD